jgi:hypothetical protein
VARLRERAEIVGETDDLDGPERDEELELGGNGRYCAPWRLTASGANGRLHYAHSGRALSLILLKQRSHTW